METARSVLSDVGEGPAHGPNASSPFDDDPEEARADAQDTTAKVVTMASFNECAVMIHDIYKNRHEFPYDDLCQMMTPEDVLRAQGAALNVSPTASANTLRTFHSIVTSSPDTLLAGFVRTILMPFRQGPNARQASIPTANPLTDWPNRPMDKGKAPLYPDLSHQVPVDAPASDSPLARLQARVRQRAFPSRDSDPYQPPRYEANRESNRAMHSEDPVYQNGGRYASRAERAASLPNAATYPNNIHRNGFNRTRGQSRGPAFTSRPAPPRNTNYHDSYDTEFNDHGNNDRLDAKLPRLRPDDLMIFDPANTDVMFFIDRVEFMAESWGDTVILRLLPLCLQGEAREWHTALHPVLRRQMNSDLDLWFRELQALQGKGKEQDMCAQSAIPKILL
ncbi:hypothetical protein ACJ73_08975 [Blastomyces percursus]|uniref:Uncharacterized protein n=1 Tax=Blastomyces percursus TaxID=1658174 RepID=A0A1J9PGI5_9EURO|nr:hypothetical protein ACJ73_08975 [Blastomyces percursus]